MLYFNESEITDGFTSEHTNGMDNGHTNGLAFSHIPFQKNY